MGRRVLPMPFGNRHGPLALLRFSVWHGPKAPWAPGSSEVTALDAVALAAMWRHRANASATNGAPALNQAYLPLELRTNAARRGAIRSHALRGTTGTPKLFSERVG